MADDSIDALEKKYSEMAVGEVDYGKNAIAIALRDERVKQSLREKLAEGFVLVDVAGQAPHGTSDLSFPVRFTFQPTKSKDIMLNENIVVVVELATKAVALINPSELASSETSAPFVIAAGVQRKGMLDTPSPIASGYDERFNDYLARLGIPLLPGGAVATHNSYNHTTTHPTQVATNTETGGRGNFDDTTGDATDWDSKIDGPTPDPDNAGFGPGEGPFDPRVVIPTEIDPRLYFTPFFNPKKG